MVHRPERVANLPGRQGVVDPLRPAVLLEDLQDLLLVVCLLAEMDVDTGLDITAMLDNGRRAEEVIGQRLRANVIRSGPVRHEPVDYDPAKGVVQTPAPGARTIVV